MVKVYKYCISIIIITIIIIYSNILLFDLKKRMRYIWEIEQDPLIHKDTSKTIRITALRTYFYDDV